MVIPVIYDPTGLLDTNLPRINASRVQTKLGNREQGTEECRRKSFGGTEYPQLFKARKRA
jgi:hypothetical protein